MKIGMDEKAKISMASLSDNEISKIMNGGKMVVVV